MDKQTKTLLGLGAIAVALYFILRPKGPNAQTPMQPTETSDRSKECENRLQEKLKTMRPDDLEGYTKMFMQDCMSAESIKYEACQMELANVMMTEQGVIEHIANCMGCAEGQIWGISSTDGKTKCITPNNFGDYGGALLGGSTFDESGGPSNPVLVDSGYGYYSSDNTTTACPAGQVKVNGKCTTTAKQLGETCVYAYEPAYILGVIGMQNGIKKCLYKYSGS
jgi:hypothetical protein